jgi:hypothetical protein
MPTAEADGVHECVVTDGAHVVCRLAYHLKLCLCVCVCVCVGLVHTHVGLPPLARHLQLCVYRVF